MLRKLLTALAVAAVLASAFASSALAQNDGGGPGVGGGAKESRESSAGEAKNVEDKRAGNMVEFDARNMQPTGPGPDKSALSRIEELKKRGEQESPEDPAEDKSGFFDPGKLTIQGRLDSREIEVWGNAGMPDGTRLSLYVLHKGKRLQIMGSAFVSGGLYRQKLEAQGRLATAEYTVEAEFLASQQPMEVREALEALDPPSRIVAQNKVGSNDPAAALTEELELKVLFWKVLESLTRSGEAYVTAHDQALAKEAFTKGGQLDVAAYAEMVTKLRLEIDAAYQAIKKEADSYVVLPMPRVWDRFRAATNALLDTTVCGAEELYASSNLAGVKLPEVPAHIGLYYVPRPRDPKKDMTNQAEWETHRFHDGAVAEITELRTALRLHSLRDLEKQFLGWVVVAVDSAIERMEALVKEAEKTDDLDAPAWIRVSAEWRQVVRLRQNRFERLVASLNSLLGPDYISTLTAEFESGKAVLETVEGLYLSYTKKLFEKKKLAVPPDAASAPDVEKAKSDLQKTLRPIKMGAGL